MSEWGQNKPWLLFCFFAGLPSLAVLERVARVAAAYWDLPGPVYLALPAAIAYVLFLLIAGQKILAFFRNQPRAGLILLLAWLLLLIIFYLVYPLHDSGVLGFSSDRDEALDIGVGQLLSGNYPYYCKAVSGVHVGCPAEGHPIAPLPGGLLLSLPFVALLGGSAVQNMFWLTIYFFVSRTWLKSTRLTSAYLLTLGMLAPVMVAEVVSGGDLLANSLAVTCALLLALRARSLRTEILAGLFLGIVLSWRSHFLLLAVPLFVYHAKLFDWNRIMRVGGATLVSFITVTLPFWYFDPDGFSPANVQQKLSKYDDVFWQPGILAVFFAVCVGVLLAYRARSEWNLLVACAFTVLTPIAFAMIVQSVSRGHITVVYGWYGVSVIAMATLGALGQLAGLDQGETGTVMNG